LHGVNTSVGAAAVALVERITDLVFEPLERCATAAQVVQLGDRASDPVSILSAKGASVYDRGCLWGLGELRRN
jgi:hypothetical protein